MSPASMNATGRVRSPSIIRGPPMISIIPWYQIRVPTAGGRKRHRKCEQLDEAVLKEQEPDDNPQEAEHVRCPIRQSRIDPIHCHLPWGLSASTPPACSPHMTHIVNVTWGPARCLSVRCG